MSVDDVRRRLELEAAGIQAMAALRDADIDVLLLKGPVTLRWLYDGEARTFVDIDLLVAPTSFGPARVALRALGYEAVTSCPVGGEQELVRATDGATIDLHRALKEVHLAPEAAWRILWSHREPFDLHGRRIDVLGEPARLFHLCSHALTSGATKVKTRDDLARGVAREGASWTGALGVARALDSVDTMQTSLLLYGGDAGRALGAALGLEASVSRGERLRALDSSGVVAMARKLARGSTTERRSLLGGWLAPEPARLERRLQRHDVPPWLKRRRPTRSALLLLFPVLAGRAAVSIGRGLVGRATR
jgi:hypothetical protein